MRQVIAILVHVERQLWIAGVVVEHRTVRLEVGAQLLDVASHRGRLGGRAAALGPALHADEAQGDVGVRRIAQHQREQRVVDEAIEVRFPILAGLQVGIVHLTEMGQAEALVQLCHERFARTAVREHQPAGCVVHGRLDPVARFRHLVNAIDGRAHAVQRPDATPPEYRVDFVLAIVGDEIERPAILAFGAEEGIR